MLSWLSHIWYVKCVEIQLSTSKFDWTFENESSPSRIALTWSGSNCSLILNSTNPHLLWYMPLALLLNLLTLAGTAAVNCLLGLWKLISLILAGLTSLFVCFQRHSPDVPAGCSVLPILTYSSSLNSTAAAWLQQDPRLLCQMEN